VRQKLALRRLSFWKIRELAVDMGAGFRVQKPLTLWLDCAAQAFLFQSFYRVVRVDVIVRHGVMPNQ
jgi:hypothetical protein